MYGLIELALAAMLMRVGVSLYAGGMSRSKNAASAAMRSVLDFALAALGFWIVGAGVRFGVKWCFGGEWSGNGEVDSRVLANLCAVLMGTGLATGAIGERSRFRFAAVVSLLLAVVVLPVTARIAAGASPLAGQGAGGWLGQLGFTDVGGAAFIFLACGMCAAVAAVVVGPRQGKFNRDGSSSAIPGHNLSVATAGAILMVAAMVPYVAGAYRINLPGELVASMAVEVRTVANVLLSSAAGALGGLLFGKLRFGKADLLLTYSGMLGAAVAIAAAAPIVGGSAAIIIGLVAGVLVAWAVLAMDLRLRIDDVAGAAALAVVGGAWGAVAVGIFGPASTGAERVRHIMVQLGGTTAIAAIAAVVAAVVLVGAKKVMGARSSEADEFDGLDLAEHDINAYPDFQQTMIKSYHMREA